jgi:hypothetical protein
MTLVDIKDIMVILASVAGIIMPIVALAGLMVAKAIKVDINSKMDEFLRLKDNIAKLMVDAAVRQREDELAGQAVRAADERDKAP